MGSALTLCVRKPNLQYQNPRANGNILLNPDFTGGKIDHWQVNDEKCIAEVLSYSENPGIPPPYEGSTHYAVVRNRSEYWNGLEQYVTDRVSAESIYAISSWIRVLGNVNTAVQVNATLKIERECYPDEYITIGSVIVGDQHWTELEGFTFCLPQNFKRAMFYLEAPPPGVELLIDSATIREVKRHIHQGNVNIIKNPNFLEGMKHWTTAKCILNINSEGYGNTTGRWKKSSGMQQDITTSVQKWLVYEVNAEVQVSGEENMDFDVKATLRYCRADLRVESKVIAREQAEKKSWVKLQGKFLLCDSPLTAVIRIEGPPPDRDITVKYLEMKNETRISGKQATSQSNPQNAIFGKNIIKNCINKDDLDDDIVETGNGWYEHNTCSLNVGNGSPRILPPMARESLGAHKLLNGRYILVTNRKQESSGPAQMITNNVEPFVSYQLSAWIQIFPGENEPQSVRVSLDVDNQCINVGEAEGIRSEWREIWGSFRFEHKPSKVMIYVHGPPSHVNFMVAGLEIFPVDRERRFQYLNNQIDKIRKRDVILKFPIKERSSLHGEAIKVTQTESKFSFGACINEEYIDHQNYVNFFLKNFSWAVFERELTWEYTESDRYELKYDDATKLLEFCEKHNMKTRGNCIFSGENIQSWVKSQDTESLFSAINKRLTDLLPRYYGRFKHYDVFNEMLERSFYREKLGNDIQSAMFKRAHKLDQSAMLFLNGYLLQDDQGRIFSSEKFRECIYQLQKADARVDGIGLKAHLDVPVGSIICAALDKLSELGLPIWITELDVGSTNEGIRALDLEVMLREMFAHHAVDGIMFWGFWELLMRRTNAHLVDADGHINEAGLKYLNLRKEWSTSIEGSVDNNGEFRFRGFHGTYEVEFVNMKKVMTFRIQEGEKAAIVEWIA